MQKFGIDISKWQGSFSIERAVKNHNVEFTILKIGGADNGKYKDKKFDDYYNQCKTNLVPTGCYYFGKATSIEEAISEAKHWVELMKDKKFEYPVFYDVEGAMLNNKKELLTDIIKTVCNFVENSGYWVGVYSSSSTFNTKVYDGELKRYSHWVASWTKEKPVLKSGSVVQIWQFGGETNLLCSNKINAKVVDQNFCYIDFPKAIKNKQLNGYSNNEDVNYKVAKEVISGIWGNGAERKQRLIECGYDYNEIQKIVNKIVRKG